MDRLRGDAVAFVHFPTAGGTKRNCPRVSSPKQERHFDRMPDLHSRPDWWTARGMDGTGLAATATTMELSAAAVTKASDKRAVLNQRAHH